MATIASHTLMLDAPSYVQTMFDWDAPSPNAPSSEKCRASSVAIVESDRSQPTARKSSLVDSNTPRVSSNRSNRRGQCQHVGGVMGAVLGQYGISIDDLISEIERLKKGEA